MRAKIRTGRAGAALGKRRRDTFEAHERGLSGKVISKVFAAQPWEDVTEPSSKEQRGKTDQPSGKANS